MAPKRDAVVRELMARHGTTYAEQARIRLADKPSPLYQLLVLANLISARISGDIAVAAARELFAAGMRTPARMLDATWQDRVDALGRGHYRRYDERTATMLGDGAQTLQDRWGGDLRRMRAEADGDVARLRALLKEVKGIGGVGADIFVREVQSVWGEFAPFVDERAAEGARRLGLPTSAKAIAGLVADKDLPRLVAALVKVSVDRQIADEVNEAAAG